MTSQYCRFYTAIVLALAVFLTAGVKAFQTSELELDLKSSFPDLEAFIDGQVTEAMKVGDVPGAVVTIVKDGQIVLNKGFGLADVASVRSVDPRQTPFRIGSISKTFIYVAAMQLVDEGHLNLDDPIGKYLEIDIPGFAGSKITIRHLMTHTAGFQESLKKLLTIEGEAPEVEVVVHENIPERVYPVGTTPAYSNYGSTLLARVLEKIEGKSFHQIVKERVFDLLGMKQATFSQPVEERFRNNIASGYLAGNKTAQPFEIIRPYPVGAASVAGSDMATYMTALMSPESPIVSVDARADMFKSQVGLHEGVNGMALGLYHTSRRGVFAVSHAGATLQFISEMHLFPDHGTGIFISMNSMGKALAGALAQRRIIDEFVKRYLAESEQAPLILENEGALFPGGKFITSRRFEEGPMSLAGLFSQTDLIVNADGSLVVSGFVDAAGNLKVWMPVGGNLYVSGYDNADRLALVQRDGLPDIIVADDLRPVQVLERVALLRSASLNMLILGFSVAIFVLTILCWPIAAIVRRRYAVEFELPRATKLARLAARIGAILALLSLAGWISWISKASVDLTVFSPDNEGILRLYQLLALLAVLATMAACVGFRQAMKSQKMGRLATTGWFLMCLAYTGFLWINVNFDLLSWELIY